MTGETLKVTGGYPLFLGASVVCGSTRCVASGARPVGRSRNG
jgi:hypothetical protein